MDDMEIKEITCGTAPLVVDFKGVQRLFSCGRATAEVLARESGAGFRIGRKRYYIVARILEYVNKIADGEEQTG